MLVEDMGSFRLLWPLWNPRDSAYLKGGPGETLGMESDMDFWGPLWNTHSLPLGLPGCGADSH